MSSCPGKWLSFVRDVPPRESVDSGFALAAHMQHLFRDFLFALHIDVPRQRSSASICCSVPRPGAAHHHRHSLAFPLPFSCKASMLPSVPHHALQMRLLIPNHHRPHTRTQQQQQTGILKRGEVCEGICRKEEPTF